MKNKSKKTRVISGLILGLMLLASVAMADNEKTEDTVPADTGKAVSNEASIPIMPDIEGKSGLTISYTYDNEKVKLDGAEISLYKIADVSTLYGEVTYTLADAYRKQLGDDFKIEEMTEESSVAVASSLKTGDIKADAVVITDADGNAVFKDLVPGIYLVSQTDKKGTAANYEYFGSFLVSAPSVEKTEAYTATKAEYADDTDKERYEKISFTGKWNYKPFVYPKTETSKIPTTPPPKTGDETSIPLYAVAGLIAILAGTILFVHGRKESKKDA